MDIGGAMDLHKKQISITPKILKLIAELDEFKGRWVALGQLSTDRLVSLKRVATIESIASSTRIEGAKLSDSAVEQLLSSVQKISFKYRDEEEVAGYSELMNLVLNSYKELQPRESIIKQLHQVLLKFSSKDIRHRGEYKKLNNHVEAFDQNGKSLSIVFETTSPMETQLKMEKLCAWLDHEIEKSTYHPLIIIGIFIVNFLAIHPFQDGNGRLSRGLTTLLLLRSNYDYVLYSSLERVIEKNKDQYYLALRSGRTENYARTKGLEAWVEFFLKCLKDQKDVLLRKLEKEKELMALPKLSEQILVNLKDHGRLALSEIVKLTRANRNTVKSHLFRLVDEGQIKKEGVGKGTRYFLG